MLVGFATMSSATASATPVLIVGSNTTAAGGAIFGTGWSAPFAAMLAVSAPNLEMHIYANGFHPGSGSTGGLTDRLGTPYGTWQYRFIDWFRDLGFLQPPGVETKAAKDTAAYMNRPQRGRRGGG